MKKADWRKNISRKQIKLVRFICIFGLITTGIIITVSSFQDKEKVSAHPTDTISLGNEEADNQFELPIDAQQLREQAIEDLGVQYSDYVQGEEVIPILEKDYIKAKGVMEIDDVGVSGQVLSVERTNYGHFFVLYGIGGSNRGGVVNVSVFNSEGEELANLIHGDMENASLRVNTILYNASNNAFLVGVHDGSFFQFRVSDETDDDATITRSMVNTLNDPNDALECLTTIVVDKFSDYDNNVLIAGRINIGTGNGGVVPGRIPVGELDVSGWDNIANPQFNGNVTNTISLENLSNQDVGLIGGNRLYASPISIYRHPDRQNNIFGTFYNEHTINGGVIKKVSFQIFDTDEDIAEEGGMVKRRKYEDFEADGYLVIKELCRNDRVYYLRYMADCTELVEVDMTTYSDEVKKTYPPNTYLNLIDNGNGTLSYYGSTTSLTGEFSSNHYQNEPSFSNYFISGIMNDTSVTRELDVVSLRAIPVTGIINTTHVLSIPSTNTLFVGGSTSDTSDAFVDDLEVYNRDGNNQDGAAPSGNSAFTGILEIKDDYSPIIASGSDSIILDLTDEKIKNPGDSNYRNWSTLDRWLITGSPNGSVTDTEAIKVYDHFDSNDAQIGATPQVREEWLQERINRNPRAPTEVIEWGKLGFNNQEVGPQLVTYFVTDSQSQPTVTSRWVNAKGAQTVTDKDNEYALDAQNFHIPLTDIDTAITDENMFKELAKTLAWSLTDNEENSGEYGNGLDEDGASKNASSVQNKLSTKVAVDNTQLAALQNATEARPYPVDVTYTPDGQDPIINRVWVFVTTTNTVPNTGESPADTNGVVYYGDDYSLPYRLRHNHDLQDVLTNGNVRAYNYYSKDRTSDELTPLPNTTGNQSNWIIHNLDVIHDPSQSGVGNLPMDVQPELSYIWRAESDYYHEQNEETRGSLQVTLTGNVLLLVRQVILDENEELVFPTEGYLKLKTLRFDQGTGSFTEDANQLANVCIPSQKTSDTPRFEIFGYDSDHMLQDDNFKMELILPEFYEYVGYFLTHRHLEDPNDLMGGDHQGKTETDLFRGEVELPKIELDRDGEYFITLYIRPTTAGQSPQPYSWDYKHNDLGEIKTE